MESPQEHNPATDSTTLPARIAAGQLVPSSYPISPDAGAKFYRHVEGWPLVR